MNDFTKLQPIHDRVLIQLHQSRSESDGGIVVPDSILRPVNTGTVMQMGPHTGLEQDLKPGDQVFFDLGCVALDAADGLRLLPADGILAILEEA